MADRSLFVALTQAAHKADGRNMHVLSKDTGIDYQTIHEHMHRDTFRGLMTLEKLIRELAPDVVAIIERETAALVAKAAALPPKKNGKAAFLSE